VNADGHHARASSPTNIFGGCFRDRLSEYEFDLRVHALTEAQAYFRIATTTSILVEVFTHNPDRIDIYRHLL